MIVGRGAELAVLDALVDGLSRPEPDPDDEDDEDDEADQADAAPARQLLLVGEPGAGKSALLDALARRTRRRGFQVLRANAAQGAADVPRGLVDDLLWTASPPAAAGGGPPSAADLLTVLARLAGARPVLLLLDDLHWADEESLAALSVVLGRLAASPVGVVATSRPAGLTDPRLARWPRLDVGPLDVDSGVALLRAAARTPVPTSAAQRLVQLLGGNALAIHEAPRLLTTEQLTGRAALPDPLPVGPGLLTAWGGVVRRLPVPAARALLAACVVGAHELLLDGVLTRSGLARGDLDAARTAGLLAPFTTDRPDDAALRHPLVRDVVLQVAEPTDIATVHAHAAAVATRLGLLPAVVVSHLSRAAGLPVMERANALAGQAERATELEMAGVAARAWEAAARATVDPALRAERAMRAVRLRLDSTLDLADAEPLLALAASSPLTPADRVYVEYLRVEVIGEADARAALAAAEVALRHARRHASELVPTLLWDVAVTSFYVGEPARALPQLESWPDRPEQSMPTWAREAVLGTALVQAGRVDEGEQLRAVARRAAATADLLDAPVPLLLNAVLLDDMLLSTDPVAEQRLDACMRRLDAAPGQTLAALWAMRSWRLLEAGQWDHAQSLAEQAMQVFRAVRSRTQATVVLPVLVWLAGARGERDLLAVLTEELAQTCGVNGDVRHAVHVPAARGRSALVAGDLERAVGQLRVAAGVGFLGRGLRDAVLPAKVDLVEALLRAGRRDEALEVLAEAAPALAALRDPLAAALLARAQALAAAEPADADDAFHRALAAHAAAHDPFEEARTRLALGEHLRRTRRRGQAREHLAAAASAFGRLGAVPWATRAEEELRAAGGSPGRSTPTAGAGLTPQERRVAEAVAQGMSTAEVAGALFLSPRTVEFHLSGAYRKLGVTRRAALARALEQLPAAGRR